MAWLCSSGLAMLNKYNTTEPTDGRQLFSEKSNRLRCPLVYGSFTIRRSMDIARRMAYQPDTQPINPTDPGRWITQQSGKDTPGAGAGNTKGVKVKRRTKRRIMLDQKRQARLNRAENPKGNSRYARKAAYCHKHGVWGFEVPNPKPW